MCPGRGHMPHGYTNQSKDSSVTSPNAPRESADQERPSGIMCVPALSLAITAPLLPRTTLADSGDALLNSRRMHIPASQRLFWKLTHQSRSSPRGLNNPVLFLLLGIGADLLPNTGLFAPVLKALCCICYQKRLLWILRFYFFIQETKDFPRFTIF